MSAGFSKDTVFATADETALFACRLAPCLRSGDTILLQGDLGAGKTHFARALIQERLARAGLAEDVPSPTFTLVQVYDDGLAEIWHCDLYRLGGESEVEELGLDTAFSSAICLVEWPERLGSYRPDGALRLTLKMLPERGMRAISLHSDDPRWAAMVEPALAGIGA